MNGKEISARLPANNYATASTLNVPYNYTKYTKWKESSFPTKMYLWEGGDCWSSILTIKEQGFDRLLERAPEIPSCLLQGSPSCDVAQKVLKPRHSNSPDRPGIFYK